MTVVAALVHRGKCYLAADSGATKAGELFTVESPAKLFRRNGWGIGFAGDWSILAHLRTRKGLPVPRDSEEDADALASGALAAWVKGCALDAGTKDWTVLVAGGGRLYVFGDDGTTGERSSWPYQAIGTGAAWALGALCATEARGPRWRLTAALEAAGRHCGAIRRPWRYLVV